MMLFCYERAMRLSMMKFRRFACRARASSSMLPVALPGRSKLRLINLLSPRFTMPPSAGDIDGHGVATPKPWKYAAALKLTKWARENIKMWGRLMP